MSVCCFFPFRYVVIDVSASMWLAVITDPCPLMQGEMFWKDAPTQYVYDDASSAEK